MLYWCCASLWSNSASCYKLCTCEWLLTTLPNLETLSGCEALAAFSERCDDCGLTVLERRNPTCRNQWCHDDKLKDTEFEVRPWLPIKALDRSWHQFLDTFWNFWPSDINNQKQKCILLHSAFRNSFCSDKVYVTMNFLKYIYGLWIKRHWSIFYGVILFYGI